MVCDTPYLQNEFGDPRFFYVFNLILSFSTRSQSIKKICTRELLGANVLKYNFCFCNCCGESVASEQQHNQDLKRIYKREYEFSNSSLFARMHCIYPECTAPHFTRVHCATNNTRMSYSVLAWIPVRSFVLIYF